MRRLAYLTILFLFINSIFAACCLSTSCGCGDVKGSSYKATAFDLALLEFTAGDTNPYDNSPLPANTSTAYNAFIFLFTPQITTVAAQTKFLMPGMAFACDPAFNPTQEFTSIRITSDADFQTDSKTFTAGEDLISLFTIGNNTTIADFLLQNSKTVDTNLFYIKLNTAPATSATHQFTFVFELSDESTITVSAGEVEVF